jgi:hypothetical protein
MRKNPGRQRQRPDRPGKNPGHCFAGSVLSGHTLDAAAVVTAKGQLKRVRAEKQRKKDARLERKVGAV